MIAWLADKSFDAGMTILPLLLKMSWEYSENVLVQNSAGDVLCGNLSSEY